MMTQMTRMTITTVTMMTMTMMMVLMNMMMKVETERKVLNFNCGKKSICSNCSEAWSRCASHHLSLFFARCQKSVTI